MSWLPLVGHEVPLAMLRNAAGRGRLGQAYLFVGPDGIGKRRFARHVAQGLLCEARKPETLDPCGKCPACVQVEVLTHPDYFEIGKPEDKNQLPIETIQQLCANLSLRPARGCRKIAVVDDADLLNDESANCFLKTLEEPPPGSVLILLGTSAETQLTTIVSRCQVLAFQPLTEVQVATLLSQLEPPTDAAEANRLAGWSGGSVALARQLSAPEWNQMRRDLVAGLASVPIDALQLTAKIGTFIEAAGKESAAKRQRGKQIVALAIEFFRKALHGRSLGLNPESEFESAAANLAGRLNVQTLLDLLERCMKADYHLGRFLNQPLVVDCWMDDLSQISAGVYQPVLGGR